MALAKDGTMRGGLRRGAGGKKKDLAEMIIEGRPGLKVLSMPEAADLEPASIPPPREYLTAPQRNGAGMCAEEIYCDTWKWLKDRGCEQLINRQLVEAYAMSISRWIQCENAVSEHGFIGKHPTTGKPIASPFVSLAQNYMRQANAVWFMIFQVVRENCSVAYSGNNPHDSTMERLLTLRQNWDE